MSVRVNLAPGKRCTRCNTELPETLAYFPSAPKNRSGLGPWCRECMRVTTAEWRKRNPERTRDMCREWASSHKNEISANKRDYYKANRDSILGQRANAYWDNPEKYKEINRQRRAANPEKYREWAREWARTHPEERRALENVRRARKLAVGGKYTAEDVRAQYQRQKGCCFYCGKKVGDKYHVDHVVPLSLGGSNGPENIVVSCPSCNCSKQAKHPMDFAGIMF